MTVGVDAAEQFGPYLVYERLGIGGMATVHRALERGIEGFERIVALKRLLPHLAEDASFIKAFVREAKLASALSHVNIVQIFELGRVGTEYFISMEHIDGRDVRRILRHARKVTGPPPIDVTVGILLQLCDALDYAHGTLDDNGVPMKLVHRDVSPSNVIVTTAGCVKVIDFGIAKAQSSQLRTQTGRVKGKLAYMAPEAVSGGRDLDARSDLFAVGVIAHELLTARPLFASKNEYQTLLKVQRGDIMPPSTYNQHVGGELDAIVLRALARDPDERYRSAAELRDDLLALRREHALMTDARDIATWLDWAFSLDIPTGAFPLDLQVDIAWDVNEGGSNGPIVLDDVPDVSDKHLRPPTSVPVPQQHDDLDDIPTPLPDARRSSSKLIHIDHEPQRSSELSLALIAANDAAATMDSMDPVRPSSEVLATPDVMGAADALIASVEHTSPAAVQQRPIFVSLSADTQPALTPAPPGPDDDEEDDATGLHSPAPDDNLADTGDRATIEPPVLPTRLTSIPSLVSKNVPLLAIPSAAKTAPSMPRAHDDDDEEDDDENTGDTTADEDLDESERSTDMSSPAPSSRPSTNDLAPTGDRYQPVGPEDTQPPVRLTPTVPRSNDHDFEAPEPPTVAVSPKRSGARSMISATPNPIPDPDRSSALKVPRTKPGQLPYRASTSAILPDVDTSDSAEASVARTSISVADLATKPRPKSRTSHPTPTIGAALLEREKATSRPLLVIIALVAIAVLATALTLAFTR